MKLHRHWIIALVLLTFFWSGVGIVMRMTDDLVSWPEKVLALMQEAPWLENKNLPREERARHLAQVIINQNRLDMNQRRTLRDDGQEVIAQFFDSLTPEEKKEYTDRTTAVHLAAISRGLRKMPAPERKQMATRIRRDMLARGQEQVPEVADIELMLDVGLEEFLKEAPPSEKLRLAPLIEDMQSKLQRGR